MNWGIIIEYDFSNGTYYIENEDYADTTELYKYLLTSIRVSNLTAEIMRNRDRVHFSPVSTGVDNLYPILTAIESRKTIEFDYFTFGKQESNHHDRFPCFVQEWEGRWYLVAEHQNHSIPTVFALERMSKVKVGKSFLLKTIYRDYLVSQGVPQENIIIVSLDEDDENNQSELASKELLKTYIYERILSDESNYYVFLDEIQEIDGFEKVVNGLNAKENIDVYITGSNSHLLSNDINTIFRGRGDEVHVEPFCFKEFCEGRTETRNELWKEFYTYGGLPALRMRKTPLQKIAYLQRLW